MNDTLDTLIDTTLKASTSRLEASDAARQDLADAMKLSEAREQNKTPVLNPFVFSDSEGDTRPGVDTGLGIRVVPTEAGTAMAKGFKQIVNAANEAGHSLVWNLVPKPNDVDQAAWDSEVADRLARERLENNAWVESSKPSREFEKLSADLEKEPTVLGKVGKVITQPRLALGLTAEAVPTVGAVMASAPAGVIGVGATLLTLGYQGTKDSLLGVEIKKIMERDPSKTETEALNQFLADPVKLRDIETKAAGVGTAQAVLGIAGGHLAQKAAGAAGEVIGNKVANLAEKFDSPLLQKLSTGKVNAKYLEKYPELADFPVQQEVRKVAAATKIGFGQDSKPLFDSARLAQQYTIKSLGSEVNNSFVNKASSLLTELPAQVAVGVITDAAAQSIQNDGKVDWNRALTSGISFAPIAAASARAWNQGPPTKPIQALYREALERSQQSRPKDALSLAATKQFMETSQLLQESGATTPDELRMERIARQYTVAHATEEEFTKAVKEQERAAAEEHLQGVASKIHGIMSERLPALSEKDNFGVDVAEMSPNQLHDAINEPRVKSEKDNFGVDVTEISPEELHSALDEIKAKLETDGEKAFFEAVLAKSPEQWNSESIQGLFKNLADAPEKATDIMKEAIAQDVPQTAESVKGPPVNTRTLSDEQAKTEQPVSGTSTKNLLEQEASDTLPKPGNNAGIREPVDATKSVDRTQISANSKAIERAYLNITDEVLDIGISKNDLQKSLPDMPPDVLTNELDQLVNSGIAAVTNTPEGPVYRFYERPSDASWKNQENIKLDSDKLADIKQAYDKAVDESGFSSVRLEQVYDNLRAKIPKDEFRMILAIQMRRGLASAALGDTSLSTTHNKSLSINLRFGDGPTPHQHNRIALKEDFDNVRVQDSFENPPVDHEKAALDALTASEISSGTNETITEGAQSENKVEGTASILRKMHDLTEKVDVTSPHTIAVLNELLAEDKAAQKESSTEGVPQEKVLIKDILNAIVDTASPEYAKQRDVIIKGISKNLLVQYGIEKGLSRAEASDSSKYTQKELNKVSQLADDIFAKRYGERAEPAIDEDSYVDHDILDALLPAEKVLFNHIVNTPLSKLATLDVSDLKNLVEAKEKVLGHDKIKPEVMQKISRHAEAYRRILEKRGINFLYVERMSDLTDLVFLRHVVRSTPTAFVQRGTTPTIVLIGTSVAKSIRPRRTRSSFGPDEGYKYQIRRALIHELVGHLGMEKTFDVISGVSGRKAFDRFLLRQVKENKNILRDAIDRILVERGYRFGTWGPVGSKLSNNFGEPFIHKLTVKTPRGQEVVHLTADDTTKMMYEYMALKSETLADAKSRRYILHDNSFLQRASTYMKHIFRSGDWKTSEPYNMTQGDVKTMLGEAYKYYFGQDASKGIHDRVSAARFIERYGRKAFMDALYNPRDAKYWDVLEKYTRQLIADPNTRYTAFDPATTGLANVLAPTNPFEQNIISNSASHELANTTTAIDLINKGFGDVNRSFLVRAFDTFKQKLDESGIFARYQALGNLNHKDFYTHVANTANGLEVRADMQARALQRTLVKLTPRQNTLVMGYFRTAGADVNTLSSAGLPRAVRDQIAAAKETVENLGQALVDLGKLNQETFDKNKGSYVSTLYFEHLGQNKAAGKKLSFMGYLKKKGVVPETRQLMKGKIESAAVLIPDMISVIGRDVAIMNFTDALINLNNAQNLGWILGSKDVFDTGETYAGHVLPDGTTKVGDPIKLTDTQLEEKIAQMGALLKDGFIGDGQNGGILNGRTPEQHQKLLERLEHYKKGLASLEEARIAEIKDMLMKQGVKPADITDEKIQKFMKAQYKKMPVGSEWGKLSGKWVKKGIYDDYVDALDIAVNGNAIAEFLFSSHGGVQNAHNYWKASKVMLNAPVSTVRNTISNLVLMDTATNTNILTLSKWAAEELIGISKNKTSRYWQYGQDFGLHSSTQASAELRSLQTRHIYALERKLKMIDNEKGILGIAKGGFHKALDIAQAIFDASSRVYGFQEALFKTVMLRDYIVKWESEHGSIEKLPPIRKQAVLLKAAEEANRALFDYARVPQWVKVMRRIPIAGSPFMTFAYKSGPNAIENFVKHPIKHLKYLLLGTVLQQWAMNTFDWSDKEMQEYMSNLDKTIDYNGTMYILPWKDSKGRPQVADIRYVFPWSDWYGAARTMKREVTKNGAYGALSGTGNVLTKHFGLFGGPMNEIIYATSGRSMFMDRPIIQDTSVTGVQKFNDLAAWQVTMWAPPWMTQYGALGHALDHFGFTATPFNAGTAYKRANAATDTGGQVITRTLGTNIYGRSQSDLRQAAYKKMEAEKRELLLKKAAIMKSTLPDKISRLREINRQIIEVHKRYAE